MVSAPSTAPPHLVTQPQWPSTHIESSEPGALIPSGTVGGLQVSAATSLHANRYCRCLLSKRPSVGTHVLRAVPNYTQYQCPELPFVNVEITVSSRARRRNLQATGADNCGHGPPSCQGSCSCFILFRQLRDFYQAAGIEWSGIEVFISPLGGSPGGDGAGGQRYSLQLGATRQSAVYLAYVVS